MHVKNSHLCINFQEFRCSGFVRFMVQSPIHTYFFGLVSQLLEVSIFTPISPSFLSQVAVFFLGISLFCFGGFMVQSPIHTPFFGLVSQLLEVLVLFQSTPLFYAGLLIFFQEFRCSVLIDLWYYHLFKKILWISESGMISVDFYSIPPFLSYVVELLRGFIPSYVLT